MKRLILVILSLALSIPAVWAQRTVKTDEWTVVEEGVDSIGKYTTTTLYEKGVVIASGTGQNWKLNAAIGTQFYIGDNDWKGKFSNLITGPAVDLYLNKWVSPNFGLGLGFTFSPMRGLYQRNNSLGRAAFMTDEYYGTYGDKELYIQKGNTFNPYVIAMVDMDNVIAGYNPERIYNVALYAGGGMIFGVDPIQTRCGATFNMGLFNIIKVYKNLAVLINLRGSLVSDSFDGESRLTEPQTTENIKKNIPFDGTLGITAGLTYHFGGRNKEWEHASKVTKVYTGYADAKKEIKHLKTELQRTNSKLEKVQAENRILASRPAGTAAGSGAGAGTVSRPGVAGSGAGTVSRPGAAGRAIGAGAGAGAAAGAGIASSTGAAGAVPTAAPQRPSNSQYASAAAGATAKATPHLWYHVQFVIDKWDVTNRELVNLTMIAEQINSTPDTKYSICGFADMQTATSDHNLMLSKNRVNEVFKVLTKYMGVNPDQLVKDYKGGVDLMFFNDNTLSRCVIIETMDQRPARPSSRPNQTGVWKALNVPSGGIRPQGR